MQKAHLYEAVFLVNQGVDQAVRGLARLKKAAGITEEIFGDTLATLEDSRAQIPPLLLDHPSFVTRSSIVSKKNN